MEAVNITEDQLKFQLDYLAEICFAEVDGENCRLNVNGIDKLLKNIK